MSNIWTKFTSKFPDLQTGNRPLSYYAIGVQQEFVCWILLTLNGYGDHLNHILNDQSRLENALEVWGDGFRNCTPKQVVNTLHTFCDGKASISNRFECNMPKNVAEFSYEMRTNQHQSASYDSKPRGLELDYDRDSARARDEKGNRACIKEAMKCLPTFGALLKKKEGRLAEIEEEGGERLELHQRRKEFYDRQMQEHHKIIRDFV